MGLLDDTTNMAMGRLTIALGVGNFRHELTSIINGVMVEAYQRGRDDANKDNKRLIKERRSKFVDGEGKKMRHASPRRKR